MESDGKQLDADTVKDVLNFVDATTGKEADVAVVAEDMKEGLAGEVGVETEATQADPVLKMVRELNRVGCGIREQCKLITDLTYEMESLDCRQYVLEELTGLYRVLISERPGASWPTAFAERALAPQASVQKQTQERFLPQTPHRPPVPHEKSQSQAGQGFQVRQESRPRT